MSETRLPLRHVWLRVFRSALALAVVLAAVFVVLRVLGTLGPRELRWTLPLGFVLMIAVPWIFLLREGRVRIGFAPAQRRSWYAIAVIAGVAAAALCFALGMALFGHGDDNWFVGIGSSYRKTLDTRGFDMLRLHLMFTIPAVLFSPVGEEIFFRGFLQEALQEKFSVRASTTLEAALFGAVHLCHHGIVATAVGLVFYPVSGPLWVVLMFLTAVMFAWLRRASGSLFPAMAGHAAFNAAMNGFIFSFLWN